MTVAAHPTASQTVGPYFAIGLIGGPIGAELVPTTAPGVLRLEGVVLDGEGLPVPDAVIEIWQADPQGRYRHPADPHGDVPDDGFLGFGRAATDLEGHFAFTTVKPGGVPSPDGGTQAPHVVVGVFARGLLKRLVTRVYFPDEAEANRVDPVLTRLGAAGRSLVAVPEGPATVRFDIRLQGPGQTTFFAL